MAARAILLFLVSILFLSSTFCYTTATALKPEDSDIDEDLKFLEEDNSVPDLNQFGGADLGDFDNYDDLEEEGADSEEDSYSPPIVDEKDVVVLKNSNFTDFIANNHYVMVEFYAPWCGHCQALAPEFAAAATELKGEAVLAKVDAAEESELAQKYEIQGFPTIYFFIDGVHKDYSGQRNKDAIVSWVKKKTGPGIHNITTIEEAERILKSEDKIVLGFIDNLVGTQSEELSVASRLEDDVNFYQTDSPDIAKIFHIDPKGKRPALVMIKKEAEQISHFDGDFSKSVIASFVFENKFPLVTIFTREVAPQIFENPIKKQLLLFAASNESEKILPIFQEAAKAFKGKIIFVYVELDNEDAGKPVADYFGVTGDSPKVLAYTGNDDGRKFVLDGELTLESVKSFGDDFVEDKLKPFFKSDPIPETNDDDVKIVVGLNFDEIVLDESKDVLLEIYAPWCGHCQSLEPIYNKLAKHLKGINSLVIAKMDGTTNEHPRAKPDGFPTLLFFPAGNKSFEPVTVDTDRTVVEFYKFIKKHAAVPFKLQKPEKDTAAVDGYVKDEL